MKKLISAASAMAMAASMVGAAVPFATGAADSTKGVELRAYLNKDGSTPSTTITAEQIAAGDVTIPIGVYYKEATNDTRGIRVSFGVSSEDGDASNKYVTFGYDGVDDKGNPTKLAYMPNETYFDANQTVTSADGKEIELNKLVCFAGTLTTNKSGGRFNFTTEYQCNVALNQATQNWKNAWGSFVWTTNVETGYTWTGKTSDAFPCYVFDCVFAKGTPAGTYTIDFIDMAPDPAKPEVLSTMVEGGADGVKVNYTPAAGNLTTKGITITVEGEKQENPTEAPTKAPTEAPTKAPTDKPTSDPGLDIRDDFIIKGDEVTAKPGETVEVCFYVQSGGHKGSTLCLDQSALPAGIKTNMGDLSSDWDTTNYAVSNEPGWTKMGDTLYCQMRDSSQIPQNFIDDNIIVCAEYTLPSDIKPGKYEINFDRFHVVEQGSQADPPIIEFDATVIPAVITVEGEEAPTDAPTDAPTKAPTDAPTEAPTKAPTKAPTEAPTKAPGKPLYGDANDNGIVDIADVVVLNKWLNDSSAYNMTAQGKLNADCCDPTGGTPDANDSLAIIQSLIHLNNGKALPWTAADLK